MSLAAAIREVAERQQAGTCRPLNLTDHELPLRALGELLDEREQGGSERRGEAANPAA